MDDVITAVPVCVETEPRLDTFRHFQRHCVCSTVCVFATAQVLCVYVCVLTVNSQGQTYARLTNCYTMLHGQSAVRGCD